MYEFSDLSFGTNLFHFVCTGFLAEVSGVDEARRSFQILSENQ